jgi:tetratricopeptide (TPR) repeat protein
MTLRTLATIVFLFLAFPVFAESHGKTCEQLLDAGENPSDAATLAAGVLGKKPEDRAALLCLGRARSALGQHEASLQALQSAEKLSATPGERIVALILIGNQYKAIGNYAGATDVYRQSLALARAEKIKAFERISLNMMGELLQQAGDVAAALEHYLQGMKLAANDNDRADSNGRLAAAYSALGNHDRAIEHQIKSMLLEERSGDLNHYANASIELGRICLAAKQYADAEKWLKKFLKAIEGAGGDYWEAKAHALLGKARASAGDKKEAAEHFEQAKKLAEKAGDKQLLLEIAEIAKSL